MKTNKAWRYLLVGRSALRRRSMIRRGGPTRRKKTLFVKHRGYVIACALAASALSLGCWGEEPRAYLKGVDYKPIYPIEVDLSADTGRMVKVLVGHKFSESEILLISEYLHKKNIPYIISLDTTIYVDMAWEMTYGDILEILEESKVNY